ncbi:MAG: hypothetical protein V3T86_13895, partial [Planctomycetota bacterium]
MFICCGGCLGEFEELFDDNVEQKRPGSEGPPIVTEQPDENIPVQFVGPVEAAEIGAPVTLVVLGEVDEVTVEVDGAVAAVLDSAPFEWTVDPDVLSDGNHAVKLSTEYDGTPLSYTFIFIIVNPALGSVDPDEVRATIAAMERGTWYEIPDTRLDAHKPVPLPRGNFNGIIKAWSGGALDTKRNRLIIWGGGHQDYAGNELYGFDLNTFRWSRLTEPSAMWPGDGRNEEGRTKTPDGRPMSRHTYDFLDYLPDPVDRFVAVGGSPFGPEASLDSATWLFDFDEDEWSENADCPSA